MGQIIWVYKQAFWGVVCKSILIINIRSQLPARQRPSNLLSAYELRRNKCQDYLWDSLFVQQQMFIQDKARNKAAVCSRRAGKTFMACAYLVISALKYEHSRCAYIALTKQSAESILWSELKKMNENYSLQIVFSESKLWAKFNNGSVIFLTGADKKDEIEKLRGQAYSLVILDECGSFKSHITTLIEEVLEPAMVDKKGTICMIGTPNASSKGYFYEKTTDSRSDWSKHHWTILQNPHIPHAKEWIAQKKISKNWRDDSPIYLREWCGQWIRDEDSLIYRYSESKNTIVALPSGMVWDYVLGVDLGFDDASAMAVLACNRNLAEAYVIEVWKKVKQNISAVAEQIKYLQSKYGKFLKIVVDTGGLGKMIVQEMRKRHQLALSPAEKDKKLAHIELLNDDLKQGKLKVLLPECQELVQEWLLLTWNEDRKKEAENLENHLADACLYAWREALHWTHRPDLRKTGQLASHSISEEEHLMEYSLENKNSVHSTWWDKL